ncbi:GOLGA4 [Bugula neritina]|uniref:GOLGA4 n=1 Tax=Bugula neritina TaxID=10212 RepID=A0A7J7K803_BUGNE|nr:GOLGA4 [Bugula neritina]
MFKKLKQKIEVGAEKVAQQVNASTSLAKKPDVKEGSLIDIDEPSTQSTPIKPNEGVKGAASATSAVDDSYVTANDSTATPMSANNSLDVMITPTKPSYIIPSDTESEAETETVVNLQAFSKEELFQRFRAVERTSVKYKNKYKQVFTAFNQAESERAKLSELLTQSQDKSFRRISELKEQSELERKSKQHLETSLQSTLEEKDTEISTLKTKINFLQEQESSSASPQHNAEELATLKEKVKRQEQLLTKCKETIKANKEKQLALSNERDALKTQLEQTTSTLKTLEAEKTSLLSEEAEALRRNVSRRDEEDVYDFTTLLT